MPKFDVVALEKFVVKTTYKGVEAPNKAAAVTQCRSGQEAYDQHTMEDTPGSWLCTVSVTPSADTPSPASQDCAG